MRERNKEQSLRTAWKGTQQTRLCQSPTNLAAVKWRSRADGGITANSTGALQHCVRREGGERRPWGTGRINGTRLSPQKFPADRSTVEWCVTVGGCSSVSRSVRCPFELLWGFGCLMRTIAPRTACHARNRFRCCWLPFCGHMPGPARAAYHCFLLHLPFCNRLAAFHSHSPRFSTSRAC